MSNIPLPRYVDLKLDCGFKAVFVDKNNRELLRKMLNLLLPERDAIAEIEAYLDREQLPDFQGGKGSALDVLCRTDDGRRFIVEMQKKGMDAFFERCVYYGSGLFRMNLERGGIYTSLQPVYVVGILNYKLKHDDESQWDTDHVVSEYQMIEKRTGELAPPTISCIFAELTRFTKTEAECRSDLDWLFYIFRQGSVVEKLAEEHRSGFTGELLRACEVAGFDKEKKLIFEQDMIQEMDKRAQDAYAKRLAREEGLKEGREEGKMEEQSSIVIKMKEQNIPLETIMAVTGLSADEIKQYS